MSCDIILVQDCVWSYLGYRHCNWANCKM